MKKYFLPLLFVFSSLNLFADHNAFGQYCGTRGNFWGTVASDYIIPDYFPPENILVRMIISPLFGDLKTCEENFDPVYLGESCMRHDSCYALLGANKDNCDEDLLFGWLNSCSQVYSDGSYAANSCKNTCEWGAEFMYNAMRYEHGNFCPSCRAFENAQENARILANHH